MARMLASIGRVGSPCSTRKHELAGTASDSRPCVDPGKNESSVQSGSSHSRHITNCAGANPRCLLHTGRPHHSQDISVSSLHQVQYLRFGAACGHYRKQARLVDGTGALVIPNSSCSQKLSGMTSNSRPCSAPATKASQWRRNP